MSLGPRGHGHKALPHFHGSSFVVWDTSESPQQDLTVPVQAWSPKNGGVRKGCTEDSPDLRGRGRVTKEHGSRNAGLTCCRSPSCSDSVKLPRFSLGIRLSLSGVPSTRPRSGARPPGGMCVGASGAPRAWRQKTSCYTPKTPGASGGGKGSETGTEINPESHPDETHLCSGPTPFPTVLMGRYLGPKLQLP